MAALSVLVIWSIGIAMASTAHPPEESLTDILRRLERKFARLRSLTAQFDHIYQAPGMRLFHESGHVWLRRPRYMRWEYTHPEVKLFVSDGKMVYLYVPADRQVVRQKLSQVDDLRAAFIFVLGRSHLREYFTRIALNPKSERPVEAGDVVLQFTPKPRYAAFAELIVEVEPSTLTLRRVSIIEIGGARSDFLFSHVRENVPISLDKFRFTIPSNVHVLGNR